MSDERSLDIPLFSKRGIEGEFVAWALVWTRDYGAGVALDGVMVDNFGNCYINDTINGNVYFRDYLGNEVNTAGYIYEIPRWTMIPYAFSVTGKYVVGEDTAVFQQMDIWREGVLIASIDLFIDNADNAGFGDCFMSSDGKFIAFVITSTATGNPRYVMLYEGT